MRPEEILPYLAAAIHVFGFRYYIREVYRGTVRTSLIGWGIQVFLVFLNLGTWKSMVGDWGMSIVPTIGSIGCVVVFVVAVKFSTLEEKKNLTPVDKTVLALSAVAVLVWYFFRSAACAHFIIQSCFLISYVPLCDNVRRNPGKEPPRPWFIWASTYVVFTAAVLMLLPWREQPWKLIYPVLGFFEHLTMALFSTRKRALIVGPA